jgi:transposase
MVSSHVHNCRGRLDGVGRALINLWAKKEKVKVSDEEISSRLNVSRATVWRARQKPIRAAVVARKPTKAMTARRKVVRSMISAMEVRTPTASVRRPGQRGRLRSCRITVRRPFPSPRSIAAGLPAPRPSLSTVRRDLESLGYKARAKPKAPRQHVGDHDRRCTFAREYLRSPFPILFSDEKYFDSNDRGDRWQWVKGRQKPDPRCFEQWASKVHVWAVIGVGFRRLVVLDCDSRVNSESYLARCIGPLRKVLRDTGARLMQDGAAAHTAAKTITQLRRWRVPVVDGWPARSPDLNPIENLWAKLSLEVARRCPTDAGEVAQFVREEFDKISVSEIDDLVRDFVPRLRKVVTAKGNIV